MHGKQFLLDALYAGIDEKSLYGRLDFYEPPEEPVQLVVSFDVHRPKAAGVKGKTWKLSVDIARTIEKWEFRGPEADDLIADSTANDGAIRIELTRTFEFKIPLAQLQAEEGSAIYLRFSLWREGLPIDALPLEGAVIIPVITEDEMAGELYNYGVSS